MKAMWLVVIFMALGSQALGRDQERCDLSGFCSDKIAGILALIDADCYSKYSAVPADMPHLKSTAKERFRECLFWVSEEWQNGFGKDCSGMPAQNACMNKLKSYGMMDVGVRVCHYF